MLTRRRFHLPTFDHRAGALALLALACCTSVPEEMNCERGWKPDPDGPPGFELRTVDAERSEMAWGHLLLRQSGRTSTAVSVINGCAETVWWRPVEDSDSDIYRAHLSRDGTRVLTAEHPREQWPDTSRIYEIDIATNTVVRTTRTLDGHHDFRELADGRVAWIAHQYLENEWFPQTDDGVVTDMIRVAKLGEQEDTDERLFSLFDDTGIEPWWVCHHMNSGLVPGYAEWSHSNSLILDEERDRMYFNARYWDSLFALEADGSVAWILGGIHGEFEPLGNTELPLHMHLSEAWDGGLLAFDNRNHHPTKTSRVVELAWDEDARTVEEVWSYEDGTFVGFLGDAKRLPNGNVLIVWSSVGRITEVTRSGDVVWEATTDGGLGRADFHSEWPPR